ncbi:hypothetical protein CF15_04925 [Pyrodictium occultum]|uniref:Thioredoxin-like fold domain-containing protein n=1 Tax=Pyrodictium occultum TaxID=2309 RepID=A0A0V8RVW2_PYROC|nr:thioredoxin domain-containing protein [Pyrodictium occultum]KSW12114.1 hypothetical protein CF15_04925 [Pyrodictium occultum]
MRGWRLYAAVAVAVAVAAAAALLLTHRGGGTAASSAAGPRACGSGPAVMVVYEKGQEKLASVVQELLSRQLAGLLPNGTRFCNATAEAAGLRGLRVYPAILVRAGNVSGELARALLNETLPGGWRPLRYDYTAAFETQVALRLGLPRPSYAYTAKLLVVEGDMPYATVNRDSLKPGSSIMEILSSLFAAKITGVEYVKKPPAGVDPRELPAFYAVSQQPLDRGVPGVRRISDNVYEVADVNITDLLLESGAVEAVEREGPPPGIEGHPALGHGRVHIAIYEDFACPYCARFYRDIFPEIKKLVDEGKITYHIVDLVVHLNPNVTRLHELLLCYYNRTGNATAYLEEATRIYSKVYKLYQEGLASASQLYNSMGKLLSEEEQRLNATPDCPAASLVEEASHAAVMAGLQGTPSFAVWVEGSNKTLYILGYRDADFFRKLVDQLEKS